ncbi:MAG: ABC transporter permease [Gammaproteobacteria bacterium SHHR-1]|uniref:ABC transporter permease n=1 Tax=Magnetovirga frankeli TaxID=947516 RepID=UPI001292F4F3|nr:ABC transporter permease [gamma proteobacterium SS-5]
MLVLHLAWRSLLNRRFSLAITLLSIALSVALLLGVERVRSQTKASFTNSLSGTDLIVGARGGQVQLLLYAVFRLGSPSNNIDWRSVEDLAALPQVDWLVPISLGDSHRGYRVLGTTPAYFRHYAYGQKKRLELAQGRPFQDLYEVVLGAEVAAKLGYRLGDELVISHGMGRHSFSKHEDKPFRVVGILTPSGTPVDRSLHVSLESIEAIHLDWAGGARLPGLRISAEQARKLDLRPKQVTALLLGLKSKTAIFQLQRQINDYPQEPLMAVLPGVALSELWGLIGVAENALLLVSACVVLVGLFGLVTALLASLNERRREMAILRSLGARPWHIFSLILGEALCMGLLGIGLGVLLLQLLLVGLQPWLIGQFGLHIGIGSPGPRELTLLASVLLASLVAGLIPALRAYWSTLSDGLSLRV